MLKDFVCGVDVEKVKDGVVYSGRRYCFSYEACRDKFLRVSFEYLKADDEYGLC